GADTFDCVSPTRVARTSAFYTPDGRFNLANARFRADFAPLVESCDCYACTNYSRAYIHHLFRAKEMVAATLVSIHNEYFVIKMVDDARLAIEDGSYFDFKAETLGKYYAPRS
ncbi:MAG: tRNA-guanine transglycosylase, partial [Acidobacteria bacterium]|nr:tRNA-guanine transglycosylase [Acidobacteriota bacterium]